MATPHNAANPGDIAKTVLMPGDPLRAKYIAEHFLENAVCYNEIRGMLGYTGTYHGKPVSVQGSGMGMPSIGIYSYELYHFYDVENIIRIGSAGAISPALGLRDIVLGLGACTDSNYFAQFGLPGQFCPIASYALAEKAVAAAREMGIALKVGNVFSSDKFYDDKDSLASWQKMGVLAVEMESAALYANAARAGKNALCLLTISDCPITGGAQVSAEERQNTFVDMMKIALETAIA